MEGVECCDVVIVGAGPAGASAARELEHLGVGHTLVDRAAFPRPKICAGILPPAVAGLLGKLPSDVVERRIRGYYIHSAFGGELCSRFQHRGYAVNRSVFDEWLVQRLGHGPVSGTLLGLEKNGARIRVRTDRSNMDCRVLIAADGSGSRARALLGIAAPRLATALQAEVPMEPTEIEHRTGGWFHVFYVVSGGYGWVAPHHDRLLVGMGSVFPGAAGRSAFSRFLKIPAVASLTGSRLARNTMAHRIPMSGPLPRPGRGNVLLAGDAGGFVFPGTGEGIRYAIMSGRAAAGAAAEYLKGDGRPAPLLKRYIARLARGGLMSLGDVDFLDVLESPEGAHRYLRRLTSLSRKASSS